MTISDLTERDLIARIRGRLPAPPGWLLVGIGDDAAVVEPERNRLEVFSVDSLVEGIHFDRAFVPPDAIGHRALAVNLSDLAAMGAAPRFALLSLALPPALPLADFDAIVGGFAALAAAHRLHVAGGNITRSPGPIVIDVTVAGTVKRRQALTRAGARAGDELYVSGSIGAAAAGLIALQTRTRTRTTEDTEKHATTEDTDSVVESLITRYVRPEPRVRLGLLLSRNRAATACMDLSDGLGDAVHQIAEASGVGAIVDAAALPIEPAARDVFARRGLDPIDAAVAGGDDYELLIAVRPRTSRRLSAAVRHGGVPLTRIGVCTADRAVLLQRGGTATEAPFLAPLARAGFSHFGSA